MRSAVAFKPNQRSSYSFFKNYFSLLSTLVWILNSSMKPSFLYFFHLLAHFLIDRYQNQYSRVFTKRKNQSKCSSRQLTNPGSISILNWRSLRANKPFENKPLSAVDYTLSPRFLFSNPLIFIRTRLFHWHIPLLLLRLPFGMILSFFLLFVPARMHPKSVWS